MNRATTQSVLTLLGSGLLLGLFAVPVAATADDAAALRVPITVVPPDQPLVPHIDQLIVTPGGDVDRLDTHAGEHGMARAEREIGEIESAVKEAAEESQELQEEARDIDND